MKKSVLLSVLAGLALAVGGVAVGQNAERPGEGVQVQPAVATWESALPIEAIFRALLQDLGYEVASPQGVSNPIFYQAVTQGDVDYWANGWFPIHNGQLPANFDESASRVGKIVEAGALGGYLVDKASVEEFGITSLEDFKRPEVKEAFDANGDGLADLGACPPGWGCEQVISHHMDVYELHDHVNPITASYSASFADIVARYNAGEPVLYYTWTPNYTTVELVPGEDVMWINVPEIITSEAQEGLEEFMSVSGVTGAVSDPLDMGFVASDIRAVANNQFLEENPAAERLFEQITIPLEDITNMTVRIAQGENSDDEILAMAQEWISENSNTVDGWLEEARSAAD
ncbi:MAG: glycine betaine/L-proline ABC transporter substrate-binding protein ProX [Trueperaceae bacterium]